MQIDPGNKLFPGMRACLWAPQTSARNPELEAKDAQIYCMHAALQCPCHLRPRDVGGPDSVDIADAWQTFGSPCTRMSQSCVLQRACDLSRAPLCGARLGPRRMLCAAARLPLAVLRPCSSCIAV